MISRHPFSLCPWRFLGYLYFLSSRTALQSFIRNPRPYLDFQIPQPKLTVRIAVVGFHKSGSATLCRLLADRHGAVCISLTELLRKDLDAKLKATLAKVKAEVETNAVEKLNNQRKREIEEIKTSNWFLFVLFKPKIYLFFEVRFIMHIFSTQKTLN